MKKDKLAKSFLKVFGFSVVAVGFILANSYLLFGLQIFNQRDQHLAVEM